MFSSIIALIVAVVGVGGTLASAILAQRLAFRTKRQELEHAERLRLGEREADEKRRKYDRLRTCYVQLHADDRNYRDTMLAYAHCLKAGLPCDAEIAEVASARRAQRDALAEAQMIVSDAVLDAENKVNSKLTNAFSSLKRIERESDIEVREPLLDEVIVLLDEVMPTLSRARVSMRLDLGTIDEAPHWF